jgi:putative hemolysin
MINMERKLWRLMLCMFITLPLLFQLTAGMLDPSAVYCEKLGYNFTIATTSEGERGMCQLPDGPHDAWNFLKGKSGREYSYCKLHGYEIKTITDEEKCAPIGSLDCAVCILENGTEVEVTRLMGLSFEEGKCGDGICSLGENYSNCPQDCPAPTTTTTLPPAKPTLPFYYIVIIFIFIAVILFFLLTRIKVQRSEGPS